LTKTTQNTPAHKPECLTSEKRVLDPLYQALVLKSLCAQNMLDFDLWIGQNGKKPAQKAGFRDAERQI
jgi:hypothetical protein